MNQGLNPPSEMVSPKKNDDSDDEERTISFDHYEGIRRRSSAGSRQHSRSYSTGKRKISASVDRSSVEFLGPRESDYVGLTAGDDDVEPETKKEEDYTLAIIFVLMVFVGLMNKVFNKLMTIPMYNYPNFLNVLTTFVYVPVCFSYIIPAARKGWIPKEQLDLPKRPFAVMGGLDAMAGIMQIFGATYLPGPLIILLLQAAIPMSMIISKILVGATYNKYQYIGAFIVAGGIMVVLAPTLNGGGSIVWCIVLMLSTVPMTLSSVYKEIALGEQELDPVYLNGWIAVFQFLFSLILCIPSSLVSEPPVGIPGLPKNMYDGLRCYAGLSSEDCGGDDGGDDCTPDDCHLYGPMFVNIYLFFNLCYNQLIILIIKYGSSNLLWLALTVMVPLGNVAFTLPFVPGHTALRVTDIIGLVVIVGGLVCFRFAQELAVKYGCEEDKRSFSYDDYGFDAVSNPIDASIGGESSTTGASEDTATGDLRMPHRPLLGKDERRSMQEDAHPEVDAQKVPIIVTKRGSNTSSGGGA